MITMSDELTNSIEKEIQSVLMNSEIRFKDRILIISDLLESFGFIKIGQGTNRMAFIPFRESEVVIKVPFQKNGILDNMDEYILSKDINVNMYLTDSINISERSCILEAQRVEVISKEEWDTCARSYLLGNIIPNILHYYVMGDIVSDVARTNVGKDQHGNYIILDYAYMVPQNSKFLLCHKCGANLELISGTELLECTKCKRRCDVNDIVDRHRRDASNFKSEITSIPTIEDIMSSMGIFN